MATSQDPEEGEVEAGAGPKMLFKRSGAGAAMVGDLALIIGPSLPPFLPRHPSFPLHHLHPPSLPPPLPPAILDDLI